MRLYVDIETYSEVDLPKEGLYKYAADCELILARFKLGEQSYTWESGLVFPDWVRDHCAKGFEVCAHNAMFEFEILKQVLPLVVPQMVCTQAKAQAHGLPASLAKACEALGAPDDKRKSTKGTALVRQFCMPRKPSKLKKHTRATAVTDPKDWALFRDEYLYHDVEALEWLDKQLPDLHPVEQAVWVHTQWLNQKGIPIDVASTRLINDRIEKAVDDYSTAFIRRTCLFPTQTAKIVQWCISEGVMMNDLTADTVDKVIKDESNPEHVRSALEIRRNISHAAFKKYPAILKTVDSTNRVRGCFQYHSAHTGRFGGKMIQPHNFPRGNVDAIKAVHKIQEGEYSVDLVKSAVRGMVYNSDGFTIADYSAIEARVLAWLANEQDALDVYRNHQDPYKWMAQYIYNVEYDEVTSEQRFVGKQAVLGLGYQMGWNRFQAQAANFGVEVDDRVAIKAVMAYRDTHPNIVRFWYNIQNAAVMAMQRPGRSIKANKYLIFFRPPNSLFLYMKLPSGRKIAYPFPEETDKSISHMHQSVYGWRRTDTYGGKLVENAVQGIARDIMVDALMRMSHLPVVMHIHDEIVVEGEHVREVTTLMEQSPYWAEDIPLEVEAHHKERFCKL